MRFGKAKAAFVIVFVVFLLNAFAGTDVQALYHEKDELVGMFKELCDEHEEYASYESVGKTYEDRDIWMFKIGNPDGGRVLWDGQLHGDEDTGSEVMYMMLEWLFESGDEEAVRILERNYVLFIPVVNMDSYRRGNSNHEWCRYGVDLNRNFKTGWRAIGCSSSQNFAGPYPASEPETQVLRSVFRDYRPKFYVNTHCGAGPYLSYYSGSSVELAEEVTDLMREKSYEMGVTPYSVRRMGSTGFAIGDAGSMGISSWLFEIEGPDTCWRHTEELYEDIVNVYYPKCLAVFLAMCQISEIEPPLYKEKVFKVVHDDEVFQVATKSNSTIDNFSFDGQNKSIKFRVTGMNGTEGLCNVTIPDSLLWGEFSIYRDSYPLVEGRDYEQVYNGTHHVFSISYVHSSHTIMIIGSHGIPEFSTWFSTLLIFALLLSTTAICILLQRRNRI